MHPRADGSAMNGAVRRMASPLPWLAGLLAVYLIAPLIAGMQQAAHVRWSSADFQALAHACEVSLASATAATVVVAIGGIPLGYLLARVRGRLMAVVGFLVQLPLALPPLVSGVLLLFLVGYGSPLGRLTHGALTDSFAGIVLAEAFVAAPFVIIAARSAFASLDPALEAVAQTLGRRPLEIFLRVSLPIARPALLSGLLLAWLRAFGEFGATVMVAYHPYSLPVYTYVAFGAQGLPAMLPILLPTLILAFVVMTLSGVLAGAKTAVPRAPPAPALRRAHLPYSCAHRTGTLPDPPPEVTLSFAKRLHGFHLNVAWSTRARRLAILGASGSGKSLTLKLIAGIERPDNGTLTVRGKELSRCAPPARAIAYVPQNYGLFPHLDLIEQLRFPAGAEPDRAVHWMGRFELGGLERRRPAALSLGQQQRVAIARALMRPADLLLLDEPFSALDAPLRATLRQELRALQGECPATTVLVTHDPMEAALLADEILILEHGRVLQAGRTGDVFRRPATASAARLLGAENPAEGLAVARNRILLPDGALLEVAGPALAPGCRVGWSFSSAQARVSADGPYVAQVEAVDTLGVERHLTVRFADVSLRISAGHTRHVPGQICRFDVDPHVIQVWPLERGGPVPPASADLYGLRWAPAG